MPKEDLSEKYNAPSFCPSGLESQQQPFHFQGLPLEIQLMILSFAEAARLNDNLASTFSFQLCMEPGNIYLSGWEYVMGFSLFPISRSISPLARRRLINQHQFHISCCPKACMHILGDLRQDLKHIRRLKIEAPDQRVGGVSTEQWIDLLQFLHKACDPSVLQISLYYAFPSFAYRECVTRDSKTILKHMNDFKDAISVGDILPTFRSLVFFFPKNWTKGELSGLYRESWTPILCLENGRLV